MSTVLTDANTQWASRPSDERFWTLRDLHDRMQRYRQDAAIKPVNTNRLRVEAVSEKGLRLKGEHSSAAFTFGSFGQLCSLTGLPAGTLREMPAELAARNLNWGLDTRDTDATLGLFDTRLKTVRGFNSDGYGRIWNEETTGKLLPLLNEGWRGAPARPCGQGDELARPATAQDCLDNIMPGLGIKVGDMIAPAGFYGNADNMFVFMVNERATVRAGNVDLCKGFFIENAETPGTAWNITTFLYGGVCGNHYVHQAENVKKAKVVHRGNAKERAWRNLYRELDVYAKMSVSALEDRIKVAQRMELGKTRDEVVKALWDRKISSRGILVDAYGLAERYVGIDGHDSPRSVWGMMGGMTRLSQQSRHADRRVELDLAAGKMMELAGLN